jgi:hypothetical protein
MRSSCAKGRANGNWRARLSSRRVVRRMPWLGGFVSEQVCSADDPFWLHSYSAAPPVVVALDPSLGWIVAGSQTLAPHRCRTAALCAAMSRVQGLQDQCIYDANGCSCYGGNVQETSRLERIGQREKDVTSRVSLLPRSGLRTRFGPGSSLDLQRLSLGRCPAPRSIWLQRRAVGGWMGGRGQQRSGGRRPKWDAMPCMPTWEWGTEGGQARQAPEADIRLAR